MFDGDIKDSRMKEDSGVAKVASNTEIPKTEEQEVSKTTWVSGYGWGWIILLALYAFVMRSQGTSSGGVGHWAEKIGFFVMLGFYYFLRARIPRRWRFFSEKRSICSLVSGLIALLIVTWVVGVLKYSR
jgi:hypothetical protein